MGNTARIRRQWPALLLAVLVGMATLLPQMFSVRAMGERFSGIYPELNNDERYYASRGQEVRDGHYRLSNPYLFEHKDGPALQFWLPDFILAKSAEALGFSAHEASLFYDFLFPAVLTLLTYSIAFFLTENIRLAVASAILLHFGIFLELFNRPVSPQFNFIFFLTLFLSLVRFIQTKKVSWGIAGTIALGALFHVYTYYWTYFFVLLPVFIFLSLVVLRKNFRRAPFFFIMAGAVVIGIPYFFQMIESTRLPFYSETIARLGMIPTHFPSGIYIVIPGALLVFCFFLLFWKNILPRTELALFVFSAVLAAPIVTNQHVLTGGNLEFSSHYLSLSVFVFVFAAAYLLRYAADFLEKGRRELVLWAIVLIVSAASLPNAYRTVRAQSFVSPALYSEQRYGKVLSWLNENTEKDSVIVSDEPLSVLVPAYTHDNVFFAREANLHFMSDEEV